MKTELEQEMEDSARDLSKFLIESFKEDEFYSQEIFDLLYQKLCFDMTNLLDQGYTENKISKILKEVNKTISTKELQIYTLNKIKNFKHCDDKVIVN